MEHNQPAHPSSIRFRFPLSMMLVSVLALQKQIAKVFFVFFFVLFLTQHCSFNASPIELSVVNLLVSEVIS